MIVQHSVAFPILSAAELDAFGERSRPDRSFDARFSQAVRLGFLASVRPRRLGPDVGLGLDLAAREALLALAGTPVEMSGQFHRKCSLLVPLLERDAYDATFSAMVRAAILVDRKAMVETVTPRAASEALR